MLTNDDIRALLSRLDGEPADSIESEALDCKEWNPAERKRSEKLLREAVVCFANQGGGAILLGVADRKRTRAEALVGVPTDFDLLGLKKAIYDGTEPHVQVQIEELVEPEGRLLVIRVPVPARRPVTTSEGLGQIRVGKECRPLTGSQIEDLLRSPASPDQALVRRQKIFSLAVGLLRATAGEMFRTSDGATSALPGALWYAKKRDWVKVVERFGEFERQRGRFRPNVEPSVFNGSDDAFVSAAQEVLGLYLWSSDNHPDFDAIRAAFGLPAPDAVRSLLNTVELHTPSATPAAISQGTSVGQTARIQGEPQENKEQRKDGAPPTWSLRQPPKPPHGLAAAGIAILSGVGAQLLGEPKPVFAALCFAVGTLLASWLLLSQRFMADQMRRRGWLWLALAGVVVVGTGVFFWPKGKAPERTAQPQPHELSPSPAVVVNAPSGNPVTSVGQTGGQTAGTILNYSDQTLRSPKVIAEDCVGKAIPQTLPPEAASEGLIYVLHANDDPKYPDGLIQHHLSPHRPTKAFIDVNGWQSLGFRCQLTNYGNEPLYWVEIMLRLEFREAVRHADGGAHSGPITTDRKWPIRVPKIDVGATAPFVFWIWNQTDRFVEVHISRAAKGVSGGTDFSKQQTIEIGIPPGINDPKDLEPAIAYLLPKESPDQRARDLLRQATERVQP